MICKKKENIVTKTQFQFEVTLLITYKEGRSRTKSTEALLASWNKVEFQLINESNVIQINSKSNMQNIFNDIRHGGLFQKKEKIYINKSCIKITKINLFLGKVNQK